MTPLLTTRILLNLTTLETQLALKRLQLNYNKGVLTSRRSVECSIVKTQKNHQEPEQQQQHVQH